MPIYVQHNSKQQGPYSLAEVKSQLASGALSLRDPVWWEGAKGWVPLGESAVFEPGFQEPNAVAPRAVELTGKSPFALATVIFAGLSCLFLIFTSVPTVVLGHCALAELKKNPRMTGRGLAVGGLVVGYVITLGCVALFASYFYFQPEITATLDREELINSSSPPPAIPTNLPAQTPPDATTNVAPEPTPTTPEPATNTAPAEPAAPMTNATPAMTTAPDAPPVPPAAPTNAPAANP